MISTVYFDELFPLANPKQSALSLKKLIIGLENKLSTLPKNKLRTIIKRILICAKVHQYKLSRLI